MKRVSLLLVAFAGTVAFSVPAVAQTTPDPGDRFDDFCSIACAGGSCDTPCRLGFNVWGTCGQYWGKPANDLDGDGVANGADNCVCTSNSNQANCDGDAYGDACDSQDSSWHKIATGTSACYVDVDDHGYEEDIEIYYADTYQSSCTGAICAKKYLAASFGCGFFQNADVQCCLDYWLSVNDCGGAWNIDSCGTPRCNF